MQKLTQVVDLAVSYRSSSVPLEAVLVVRSSFTRVAGQRI